MVPREARPAALPGPQDRWLGVAEARERLEFARTALEVNAASIKLIAHRVGHAHVGNFTTTLARRHGATPAHFRRHGDEPQPPLPLAGTSAYKGATSGDGRRPAPDLARRKPGRQ
jgi:hypothetical protein